MQTPLYGPFAAMLPGQVLDEGANEDRDQGTVRAELRDVLTGIRAREGQNCHVFQACRQRCGGALRCSLFAADFYFLLFRF